MTQIIRLHMFKNSDLILFHVAILFYFCDKNIHTAILHILLSYFYYFSNIIEKTILFFIVVIMIYNLFL